jgi:hypothetical protein
MELTPGIAAVPGPPFSMKAPVRRRLESQSWTLSLSLGLICMAEILEERSGYHGQSLLVPLRETAFHWFLK